MQGSKCKLPVFCLLVSTVAGHCSNGQNTVQTGKLLFQRADYCSKGQVTVPTANHYSNGQITVPTGILLFQRADSYSNSIFAFQAYLRLSSKHFEISRTPRISRKIVILLYHCVSLKLVFMSLKSQFVSKLEIAYQTFVFIIVNLF